MIHYDLKIQRIMKIQKGSTSCQINPTPKSRRTSPESTQRENIKTRSLREIVFVHNNNLLPDTGTGQWIVAYGTVSTHGLKDFFMKVKYLIMK